VSTPSIRASVGSACGFPVHFWINGPSALDLFTSRVSGEGHPFVSTPSIRKHTCMCWLWLWTSCAFMDQGPAALDFLTSRVSG
jgi:hypothetical protein